MLVVQEIVNRWTFGGQFSRCSVVLLATTVGISKGLWFEFSMQLPSQKV